MRRLTKGLMDFSHRAVERRRQRVNEIVREAIDFVSPQNRYDHVSWRLDLDPSEPESDLDGGQFRQVLLNLFQNAVEAMAGAGVAKQWIAVATRARAGTVEIRVCDAGPGIPAPIRARIFEPWFTTKSGGHGFGLAVCYRIVRNHGGTIAAQNGPDGGAEVVITLPARGTLATPAALRPAA
jgi:two-component system sensor histidine kinase HupT/HoxJ